jgi:hypothetical protein
MNYSALTMRLLVKSQAAVEMTETLNPNGNVAIITPGHVMGVLTRTSARIMGSSSQPA